jgi:hypothetical protein
VANQLLQRLSSGKKSEAIPVKEMLKLTQKNYNELPEVKKKRQDERLKEDLKKRQSNVKLLEKQRRETLSKKNKKNNKENSI